MPPVLAVPRGLTVQRAVKTDRVDAGAGGPNCAYFDTSGPLQPIYLATLRVMFSRAIAENGIRYPANELEAVKNLVQMTK
jgi:hypothetical protein